MSRIYQVLKEVNRHPKLDTADHIVRLEESNKSLRIDNAKLRVLVSSVLVLRHDPTYEWLDARLAEICGKGFTEQARELGVEVTR